MMTMRSVSNRILRQHFGRVDSCRSLGLCVDGPLRDSRKSLCQRIESHHHKITRDRTRQHRQTRSCRPSAVSSQFVIEAIGYYWILDRSIKLRHQLLSASIALVQAERDISQSHPRASEEHIHTLINTG